MSADLTNVETLLEHGSRAGLPLSRQVLLYLDPFALFKDASRGPLRTRELALKYNRAMRWMLLSYVRRWIVIAAALFLALVPAEALAAQASVFIIPAAALAVGACIALTVTALTLLAYLLLGAKRD